jgi:hypothetical protein
MSTDIAVRLEGVAKRYGEVTALDGASFQLGRGESEGTVRNHLSAAIRKTRACSRVEALRTAEDKGWL